MKIISRFYKKLANDSLYRNSIFLMLDTGVMSLFGFVFWIINARLFVSSQVGIATTLISVVALISSFSLLGLNNAIVRYLPTSKQKNQNINTSFTLVALTSLLLALVYLIFINIFSPKLLFIRENIFLVASFVLFIIFSTLNSFVEYVFIAYRSSKYILIKNSISSLVKLALPFLLVSLGAYGIFTSVGVFSVLAFILSLLFLIYKFSYLIRLKINYEVVKRIIKYSLSIYVTGFIGGLPAMILPILILNIIGAKFSAYFYMDMMIVNLLYVIPSAVSRSLFAEGSYSEFELKEHIKKAVKMISLFLIPAIIITFFFGKYILLAFGKEYSSEGITFLRILAVSGIFVSANYVFTTLFYIKNKIKVILLVDIVYLFVILSLSTLLIHQNLIGIGIALISGEAIASLLYIIASRVFAIF